MAVVGLGPHWAQLLLTPYGLVHTIGVTGCAKSMTLVPFHGIELPGYWVARCHLQMYLAQLSGPPFSSPVSGPISALAISDNGLEGKILGLTTLLL